MIKRIILILTVCGISSCINQHDKYSFTMAEDEVYMEKLINWRAQNHKIEPCIISFRNVYSDAKNCKDKGVEVTGTLAEYFNFMTTLPPQPIPSSWFNKAMPYMADIYVKDKHYIWAWASSVFEKSTGSAYHFPFNHDVLCSVPAFAKYKNNRNEGQKEIVSDFNLRWNSVMDAILHSWQSYKRGK